MKIKNLNWNSDHATIQIDVWEIYDGPTISSYDKMVKTVNPVPIWSDRINSSYIAKNYISRNYINGDHQYHDIIEKYQDMVEIENYYIKNYPGKNIRILVFLNGWLRRDTAVNKNGNYNTRTDINGIRLYPAQAAIRNPYGKTNW